MSGSAHVLSVRALEDLKAALRRFADDAQTAIQSAAQETARTIDWLMERHSHWQHEVYRRQEYVTQARRALATCQASAYYDPKTGQHYVPNCQHYEEAVMQARVRLLAAEDELRNVQRWKQLVERGAEAYQRQAERLAVLLAQDLPRSTALLGRKIDTLYAYMGETAGSSSPPPPNLSSPPISLGGHPETAGGIERERGPEALEGGGSPERR